MTKLRVFTAQQQRSDRFIRYLSFLRDGLSFSKRKPTTLVLISNDKCTEFTRRSDIPPDVSTPICP